MPTFWNSFQARVTAVLVCALLFVVAMSDLAIHQFSLQAQFEQLREELMVVARVAAVSIDSEALKTVPLTREGMETPQYKDIRQKLQRIREDNPKISYVYILTKTGPGGGWKFIVDADPEQKKRQGITSYPGDSYDPREFPEMVKAWDEATADRKLGQDAWGVMLSGYSPMRDSGGRTIAVLGVDMLASDVYQIQQAVHLRSLLILFLGILVSIVLGMRLSRKITGRVEALAEGTRRIRRGDLTYKVKVKGHDEIAELADDFNQMARDLFEARKKNSDYFCGVIQSLVKIVEAKDPYTRGHSERVSEYAVKIARKMDHVPEDLEMLKQVAVLHDIGKLGIQDAILNKPDKLDPAEWNVVRMHPVVGEDILKPVFFDPRMLSIVRAHHERHDGKGYPDGLKEDKIDTFAQILTVADSYDAMTSSRAYRKTPLGKKEAIAELQKNKGTQFNPDVVDVFCKILQE